MVQFSSRMSQLKGSAIRELLALANKPEVLSFAGGMPAPELFPVDKIKAATDAGVLLITHYTRILRYIQPQFVHVFVDGRIAEEGGPELAERLEAEGYDRFLVEA